MQLDVRLDRLSDDLLLDELGVLVERSQLLTAELLVYLGEVDQRRLYLREACSSMFAFCVERLHLAEGAAYKRVAAARAARRFPVILDLVARGEIHLTGVCLIAPHLTEENHEALLARARHLTKREVQALIAEIAPRPDVPARVARLPRRVAGSRRSDGTGAGTSCRPAPSPEQAVAPAADPVPAAASPAVIEPLAPERFQIRVTVGEETHAALRQLQDLLAHEIPDGDPAAIIGRALDLLLEKSLARKAAVTKRPRQEAPAELTAERSRYIPAAIRRAVWKRDGGRCAHVDAKGRRCSATRFLEFHHVHNWARGAEHDEAEIQIRCRAHNQYQARLDYGAAFMESRRNRTGASEPRQRWGLPATARVPRSPGWASEL